MIKDLDALRIELAEVRAYRDLQGKPFDFGTGLVTDDSRVSEDVYYKMRERVLLEAIEDLENALRENVQEVKKNRNNRYIRKREGLRRLEALLDKNVYTIYRKLDTETGNEYITQIYLSKRRKSAKKKTNRRVRKSKNDFKCKGGAYRRKYNYWWDVF